MSRVQLCLNVTDFDAAVAFYSRLFGTAPAKLRPGYANFAIADPPLKLVLNAPGNGAGGTINHLGVEVGSTDEVDNAAERMAAEGLETKPAPGTVCCYALPVVMVGYVRRAVLASAGRRSGRSVRGPQQSPAPCPYPAGHPPR
jgi:catechol 2,3-dioxygenase-like lactoylglutathione lyase family enzyme